MSLDNYTVSVIIPAFNAGKFIQDTLDSAFNQTFQPHEVIIIDDGSTDNTKEVIKPYNVKYIFQENQGTSVALNTGVFNAEGNILAFLDHDDIWLPNKLELQIEALMQDSSTEMIFSLIENRIVNASIKDHVDVVYEPMIGIHKSAFMIKKSTFLNVGYFPTQSGTQEFLDWFSLAKDMGLSTNIVQEVLVYRTIHGNNQAISNKNMKNDFPKVLKSILDRRRAR